MWKKYFPWKKTFSHKYSRGRVIVYGGQKEFTGATILSAQAALRTGTGSVKIICSKDTLQIYSIKFPSVLKTEINDIYYLEKFLKMRLRAILEAVESKNGLEPITLNLCGISSELDAFLICHGTSSRHVRAISEAIKEKSVKREITESVKIEIKKMLKQLDELFIPSVREMLEK